MMRSATAFLPPSMITFMHLESSTLPNLGSGRISRLGTSRRRGMFTPQICFSWRLFRHRENPARFSLTRPDADMALWGHYAQHGLPAGRTPNNKSNYFALGRLAPYLERDCLRSFTP